MTGNRPEPKHEPRKLGGVPVTFCECTFHAVNGSSIGLVPTCSKHGGLRRAE